MYKVSRGWSEWYREPDPERRRDMLEVLQREEPDDGANEYRSYLFERRHGPAGTEQKDVFLWHCVNFSQIYESAVILKGLSRKEVREALRQIGYDKAAGYGEAGEGALYWEIRNAARRYFKTCQNPEYRKVLFGLMNSSSKDKKNQMCKDAWQMSAGLGDRLGMSQELEIWIRAVTDEYSCQDPNGAQKLSELGRKETSGRRRQQ